MWTLTPAIGIAPPSRVVPGKIELGMGVGIQTGAPAQAGASQGLSFSWALIDGAFPTQRPLRRRL